VAPGSERAVTSAARLESALVRLAAARRERTASTKATPTAARGLPLGSEGSSGGVAPSLGGGLQALAARFGTPESDGARPMPTSESSRQDPSARRAATGFEDGAEALPPLPRPLLERLSRNELTRRLDEILRHEAERSGVDFNRRMP
ncbi:MAG TPA: hypothetical protein VFQ35_24735, partial [Polyangiaceae bacterium]|nr:hypothetical protein [Polyangiaceae bacterium]